MRKIPCNIRRTLPRPLFEFGLAVLEQRDEDDASGDVAGGGQAEPLEIGEGGDVAGENGGQNFSAGRDAVGEMAESHDKGEDPDNGN